MQTAKIDESASRVVSLVPSITEALVSVRREAVVGATDWCTHPADLDDTLEARVRGTKNPNLDDDPRAAPRRGDRQPRGEPRARRTTAAGVRRPRRGHADRDRARGGRDLRASSSTTCSAGSGRTGWPRSASSGAVRCPPVTSDGRHPDLARPVDGGRRFDVHRRPGPAAGLGQRVRRQRRPLPEGRARRDRGGRRGPRAAARRAVRLHRRGRSGGLPRTPRPGWSAAGC